MISLTKQRERLIMKVTIKDTLNNKVIQHRDLRQFCLTLAKAYVDKDYKEAYRDYLRDASLELLLAYPSLYELEVIDPEVTPNVEQLEADLGYIQNKIDAEMEVL
jgi:hypothetical protein